MFYVRYRAQVALYTFILFIWKSHAQDSCQSGVTPPFKIPVRNVSLANNVLRRGVPISIGTPPQRFAFWVHANDANNTFVYKIGGDQCESSNTPIQCQAFLSGQFDPSASSSWSEASSLFAAGGAVLDNGTGAGNIFGTDVIHLNTSANFTRFPISIQDGKSLDSNALGLATNSTLLSAMINAKLIASRTWSLFWGLTGSDKETQMDGTLLLGGYDLAKTKGRNSTQSLTTGQGCDLFITVTNIKMNFPNTTDFEILATSYSSGLRMCITPEYPIITIPFQVWESFKSYAGGTYMDRSYGINLWGQLYEAAGVYAGDLTFTLSTGLQIRIPNNQLVVPDIHISDAGQQYINDTTREVLLNSLQDINADDIPKLGHTFLTSTYLYVNNDENAFTIWQSNPTTDENIISVGPSTTSCSSIPVSTATSSASASSLSRESSQSNPVPIGAVVGAAVGGVALLLLIGLTILYLRRRKRHAAQAKSAASLPRVPPKEYQMENDTRIPSLMQELPAYQTPQELADGDRQRHELG
ncbi:MAG: hypothetical protein Q9187_006876 [Circinaria calcarea]